MHDQIDNLASGTGSSQPPVPAPAAPTSGEIATTLARNRTDMAMSRNYMAAERTLMAWIRTALSMISFGFTIAKLGQAMHDIEIRKLLGGVRVVGVRRVGDFLVILGTLALLGAVFEYWQRVRELRGLGLRRQASITLIVALLLVIVGALALTSLVSSL